jgi:hypothetical protein
MRQVKSWIIFYIMLTVMLLSFPSMAWAQTPSSAEVQQVQTDLLNSIRNVPNPSPADLDTKVRHVAIVENYALVDISYGQGGGEALLIRQQGRWVLIQRGGGSFAAEQLIDAGVPNEIASQLVKTLQSMWSQI